MIVEVGASLSPNDYLEYDIQSGLLYNSASVGARIDIISGNGPNTVFPPRD